jgi:hypothetical protein
MSMLDKYPKFVKHLRTLGDTRIVKDKKDGKVGNREITMAFVEHADGHTGNCHGMYNLVSS